MKVRERLRQLLARYGGWLPRRGGWTRRVLSRIAAKRTQSEETDRVAEARAHFWAELRAGQREAEAGSSRPRT